MFFQRFRRRFFRGLTVLVLAAILLQVGVPWANTRGVLAVGSAATESTQVRSASAGLVTDAGTAAYRQALAQLRPDGPGEIPALRRANSRTYRTDKGYRVEVHVAPIYYEAGPGIFERPDNTLVPAPDGSPYKFQNKASSWQVKFTDRPSKNQMRVDFQGRWFTLDLDEDTGGGAPGSAGAPGQGAPGDAGATAYRATASGNKLTYEAPSAPSTLTYEVQNQSVKESIILHRPPDKNTWAFRLAVNGFVPKAMSDGHIGLMYDSSVTEEAMSIDRVFAVDSAGARTDGALALDPQPDGSYLVKVGVDRRWLDDPVRKYPVTIDPSISLGAETNAGMWTVIQDGITTPYSGNLLRVKGDGSVRSLMKFDFRSLDRGLIPGNQLVSARLNLFYNTDSTYSTGTQSGTFTVQPLHQDWFRNSATWTRPRWSGTSWAGGDSCATAGCTAMPPGAQSFSVRIATSVPPSNPPPAFQIDLTAAVQRYLDGSHSNDGFLLTLTDDPNSWSDVYLCARDANGNPYYDPYFQLDFAADTTAPTVSITSPTDGSTLQSPVGTPPGTVNVGVSASDTVNGGAAGNLSRVELLLDNNVVASAPADAGGTFTFAINPSQYVAGRHRLAARAYDRAGNRADSATVGVTFRGGLLTAPDNLVATPTGNGSYNLKWAPARAMRPSDSEAPATVTYTVQRATTSDFATPVTVATGVTATTGADTPGAGTYYYRVQAVSQVDGGTSGYSNVATNGPPVAPFGVVITNLPGGGVALAWHASPNAFFDPRITYDVYRTTGGVQSLVASGVAGTTWTDTSTVAGTAYTYSASAVDAAGRESARTAECGITAATSTGPAAPTGVTAIPGRGNVITLLWDGSSDPAVTYRVSRSTDRTAWSQVADGLTGWFFNDLGLSEGVTYYYTVRAVSNGTVGPLSAVAGAQAANVRRFGVDVRFPFTSFAAGDGTAYLNLNSGNLVLTVTDSVVAAPYLPVTIRRTYNSQGGAGGALGGPWRLNTDWHIDDYGGGVILTAGDGNERAFTFNGSTYQPDKLSYWTLTKDGNGSFVATRPDRVRYQFDSLGRLSSITERNGNRIAYAYDSQGRLSTVTDPVGRVTSLAYDALGRLSGITDGAGRATTYGYDTKDRLASVTDSEGMVTTYGYGGDGRLAYAADPSGRWTSWTYDDAGRVVSIVDGLGHRTAVAYQTGGAGGGTADLTDPLGGRTTFVTNADGLLTQLTDAFQNTQGSPKRWSYSYSFLPSDPNKLQTETITSPDGLSTQLTHDTTGNVTQVVDTGTDLTAPGVTTRTTSMSYLGGSSDLTQVVDAENHTTAYNWSATDPYRLLSAQDAAGDTVQFTYSTAPAQPGWITAITDARNNQRQFTYDAQGNVTAISYPMGGGKTLTQSMTYYADGSVKDASELHDAATPTYPVTHYDNDKLGRVVRVEYPDGSAAATLYDWSGNVALQVGRGGQRTIYAYDASGQLLSSADQGGNTTTYVYDAAGNTTAVTDPRGSTTSYQYDPLHRVRREQLPSGLTTLSSYDEMGHLTALTKGHSSIVDTAGYTVTATYYLAGPLRQVGEPLPSGSVLLSNGTNPPGATVNNTVAYEYNKVGAMTRQVDSNGLATTYGYDTAGRLLTVTDAAGGLTEYTYDPNGNRTRAVRWPISS